MKKKRNITPFMILGFLLGCIDLYLIYNVIAWEEDWMYAHKALSFTATGVAVLLSVLWIIFMWKNTGHSD